jgi:hypothetical protein
MTDSRANIKLSRDEFQELKEEKPDGMTWGYYLVEYRTVEDES